MIIFGIDPGLANTGYGVIKKDLSNLMMIDYGSIRTKSPQKRSLRLKKIHDELLALMNKYKPDCVSIEELFFAPRLTSAISVGEAIGVAMLAAVESNAEVYTYKPAEIKQAVVGYGNATKYQVQQMVKVLLSLDKIPKPNHAADALAMAICHANSIRLKSVANEYNGGLRNKRISEA